eukprot:8458792-Prorocentrum_lima.AAC.1
MSCLFELELSGGCTTSRPLKAALALLSQSSGEELAALSLPAGNLLWLALELATSMLSSSLSGS